MPENNWNKPNFWLSAITLDKTKPKVLIEKLYKVNIEARPIWKPMHLQPIFKEYDYIGDNIAQILFETGICLPSDTKMTDEDLYRVTNAIKKALINEE